MHPRRFASRSLVAFVMLPPKYENRCSSGQCYNALLGVAEARKYLLFWWQGWEYSSFQRHCTLYWPYCLLDKEQTLKTCHSLFLWPRKINHRQIQHVERQSVMGSPCPYHVSGTYYAWDTWDLQAQASMPDRSHAVPEIHFSGGAMLVPWRILTWICNQKCTHTKIVWFMMLDMRWNSWVNLIKFEQFKIFVVHVCQREFNVHFQVCVGLRRKRSRMTKEWVFARLWDFMIYCIQCALYDWCTTDVQVYVFVCVYLIQDLQMITVFWYILIYFDVFCIAGNYSDLKWEQCELGLSMCFL